MSSNNLVSVIIPTYKNRGLLSNSIDSALAQNYEDIEIIVVDDNDPSSDGRKKTEEIMSSYEDLPNVYYIKHEKNKNGAAARNTGINASNGQIIAFLDDDDEFLPGKIKNQVDFLVKHPEFQAVYNYAAVNGRPEPIYPYEGNAIIPLLKCRTKMFTPSLMFWKSALITIGGFDESFKRHQDYELLVKFFNAGFKIGCVKKILTNINSIGGNRLSGKKLEELKATYLKTFDEVLDKLDLKTPGLKKDIVNSNYASLFISHVVSKDYKLAFKLAIKQIFSCPIVFITTQYHILTDMIKRKLGREVIMK